MARVYCAGPLFNEPEKREMAAIAAALEKAGHETFLPQRDGFELADVAGELQKAGTEPRRAVELVHRAIFHLDVYHLLGWSEAAVANLNGRVPDEGTVVEAALAWHAGKALVLYKRDERAPFAGDDNPMLTCLADCQTTASLDAVPAAVTSALGQGRGHRVARALGRGKKIADYHATGPDAHSLAAFLTARFAT